MLSLVIPVYNAEKYLPRLMRGVLEQTCGDFEVILVDDGSTDGSLALCRSYASERVRVVSVPNGGPAMARNHGIDACSPLSRHVVFADSDDEIAPDYLTALMQEPEADFVVAGRVEVFPDRVAPYREFPLSRSFTEVRTDPAFAATTWHTAARWCSCRKRHTDTSIGPARRHPHNPQALSTAICSCTSTCSTGLPLNATQPCIVSCSTSIME